MRHVGLFDEVPKEGLDDREKKRVQVVLRSIH